MSHCKNCYAGRKKPHCNQGPAGWCPTAPVISMKPPPKSRSLLLNRPLVCLFRRAAGLQTSSSQKTPLGVYFGCFLLPPLGAKRTLDALEDQLFAAVDASPAPLEVFPAHFQHQDSGQAAQMWIFGCGWQELPGKFPSITLEMLKLPSEQSSLGKRKHFTSPSTVIFHQNVFLTSAILFFFFPIHPNGLY